MNAKVSGSEEEQDTYEDPNKDHGSLTPPAGDNNQSEEDVSAFVPDGRKVSLMDHEDKGRLDDEYEHNPPTDPK